MEYGKEVFQPVSLPEMLLAREKRAKLQKEMLKQGGVLVCLTLNIPGPRKVTPLIFQAFYEGMRRVEKGLSRFGKFEKAHVTIEKTGLEAFYCCFAEIYSVKKAMCEIEEAADLGRIWDIDVLNSAGEKISREEVGFSPRSCLLCDQPAFLCARSRRHAIPEMIAEIERRIRVFRDQEITRIGRLAVLALRKEAETTPKPGLVDRRNSGSHPDMTLALLLKSADALKAYFIGCAERGAEAGKEEALFPALQSLGLEAERKMLDMTGGINTHKGAIFSMGLLCAAAGLLRFQEAPLTSDLVCQKAGEIVSPFVDQYFAGLRAENARTCGEKLYMDLGCRGIRGEAADGFPSLQKRALPALQNCLKAGFSENDAGVRALLCLLAYVEDTTLLKRGGKEGADFARREALRLLQNRAGNSEVEKLDDAMIEKNLTCGGCADLLACAYFLRDLTQG